MDDASGTCPPCGMRAPTRLDSAILHVGFFGRSRCETPSVAHHQGNAESRHLPPRRSGSARRHTSRPARAPHSSPEPRNLSAICCNDFRHRYPDPSFTGRAEVPQLGHQTATSARFPHQADCPRCHQSSPKSRLVDKARRSPSRSGRTLSTDPLEHCGEDRAISIGRG